MGKLTANDYKEVYEKAKEKVDSYNFKKYMRSKQRVQDWNEAERAEKMLDKKQFQLDKQKESLDRMKKETERLKNEAIETAEHRHKREQQEAIQQQFEEFKNDGENNVTTEEDKDSFEKMFDLEQTNESFSKTIDRASTVSISD